MSGEDGIVELLSDECKVLLRDNLKSIDIHGKMLYYDLEFDSVQVAVPYSLS